MAEQDRAPLRSKGFPLLTGESKRGRVITSKGGIQFLGLRVTL
jgi:hypothetical protein